MADTAFQTLYRSEFIASFEQHQSLLRDTVTTEANVNGNTAVFLVSGSGGASAQTRGVNGLIPARADDNTQTSCTLEEWNDLVRKTNFNIYSSQGNQRQIMQMTTMGVINRKVDEQIIDALSAGTVTIGSGTPVTGSINTVMNVKALLGAAKVPWDGNITFLISSGFMAYLMQAPEFSKGEYVSVRPFESGGPSWRDSPQAYRWMNMLFIEHPQLSLNSASEICYAYHRSAVGHAANTPAMESEVGYNGEQGYSWARASIYMNAKLLQNTGVVKIYHDSSAFAAS